MRRQNNNLNKGVALSYIFVTAYPKLLKKNSISLLGAAFGNMP